MDVVAALLLLKRPSLTGGPAGTLPEEMGGLVQAASEATQHAASVFQTVVQQVCLQQVHEHSFKVLHNHGPTCALFLATRACTFAASTGRCLACFACFLAATLLVLTPIGMLSASTDAGRADQSSELVTAVLLSLEQLPAWTGTWNAVTAGTTFKG